MMSNGNNGAGCALRGWLVAAAIGAVILLLLWLWAGLTFWAALFYAISGGLIIGSAVLLGMCGTGLEAEESAPVAVPVVPAAPEPSPEPAVAEVSPASEPTPEPEATEDPEAAPDADREGKVEGGDGLSDGGTRPEALSGPRDGKADDLKQIKGVGPALEKLCNELGFYHFDQIANWTADEVAWVDTNLKGFKGRVSRDGWVEQAKVLAAGGTTEFSAKVKKGGVYD